MPAVSLSRPLALLSAVCLLASGCGGADKRALEGCAPDRLATLTKGKLTLSTGVITRSPWVSGPTKNGRSGDPRNGQGYDAAVGLALGQRLGFEKSEVTWVAAPFAEALAAGKKSWDVNINQVSMRDDRRINIDFSRPYYTLRQAVVTLTDREAAKASDLDDLRHLTFAVLKDSPAQTALARLGQLDTPALVYDDFNKVRGSVSGGTDALVTDYVTALRLDSDESQLVNGTLLGVLPKVPDQSAEQFGMVLEKGSSLTGCVDVALDAMDADGTLERLERKWLVEQQGWKWFA